MTQVDGVSKFKTNLPSVTEKGISMYLFSNFIYYGEYRQSPIFVLLF